MAGKSTCVDSHLSFYAQGLSSTARCRYIEKLRLCKAQTDPYNTDLSQWTPVKDVWPSICYPDIYSYLVESVSPYTKDTLKNWKSMDAYTYFVAGFVSDVLCMVCSKDTRIITAKVKHSMRMSEPPLKPWVAAMDSGQIICAHCTCMAGLGEACSHIAALLFSVMTAMRMRDEQSCTSGRNQWIEPSLTKKIEYLPISDILFRNPKTSMKRIATSASPATPKMDKYHTPKPSQAYVEQLYALLHAANPSAVALSVKREFQNSFVPKPCQAIFPTMISSFFTPNNVTLNYQQLTDKCEEVCASLSVTEEQVINLEKETRLQSKSKMWFHMRAGRITASNFKAAAHTNPASPALSFVRRICYPKENRFTSAATSWGCEHEKDARTVYSINRRNSHDDFTCSLSGLHLSTEVPYVGATPDSIINCACCGYGVLEVKCPHSALSASLTELADKNLFCLEEVNGHLKLKNTHAYYYQVQAQMYVCKAQYCDFVVWTPQEVHIEKVVPDMSFMTDTLAKIEPIYKYAVLPEMIGRFYGLASSVAPESTSTESGSPDTDNNDTFCYCGRGEEGSMVGCDNSVCLRQWFHLPCLKLKSLPKTKKWFCPDCRKIKNKKVD